MSTISNSTDTAADAPQGARARCVSWLAQHRLPLCLLTLLVAVVHGPSVSYDFVNWDDSWYVTDNPLIKAWTLENLHGIATQPVARNFAPLTVFTLLIDHTFWGLNPAGYHLTNVVLHAINTILVWSLVRRLVKDDSIAIVTAVLFAVHPVQVESVAWISSRKTLLSTTCMLASGLCWLRHDRHFKHEMWGSVWLLLGLLSKASAVVVPPIVLLYDVLIHRQRLSDAIPRQLVPGFLCLVCINLTMGAQVTIVGGIRDHIGLSKLHIIGIDSLLLFRYLRMLVWPSDLAILYDVPIEDIFWAALAATCFWLCLIAVLWTHRECYPWLAWLAATWVLLLFPMLNFFPLTTLINDRYLYLPSVPIFVAVLYGAKWCACRVAARRHLVHWLPSVIGVTALASVIVTSSLTSAAQAEKWRNPISLWGDTMQQVPQLTVVRIQWAISLHQTGRTAEAREVLQSALSECAMDEHDRKRVLDKLAEWDDVGG